MTANDSPIPTGSDERTARERREVYMARLNRAIDFIESHLHDELTLEAIAKAACFSPFHFHRLFGAMVGESVSRFIQRVRTERAASLLIMHPNRTVTEVAIACGFSSPAVFARTFKQTFSISATEWRSGGHENHKRNKQTRPELLKTLGDLSTDYAVTSFSLAPNTGQPQWRIRTPHHPSVLVEVQPMPAWHVAYVRHTGPYQGMGEVFEALFNKLMSWAVPRGLLTHEAKVIALYHDDPSITEDAKLRVSGCLTVPQDTKVDGVVGAMSLEGGIYAVGRFELGEKDYTEAWYAMMGSWLPESGYEPDDRPCYELFQNDCSTHPTSKSIVDICIPVRPLRPL